MRNYKPRNAILLASDYEDLQPARCTGVIRFVMDGKDKDAEVEDKGKWSSRPLRTRLRLSKSPDDAHDDADPPARAPIL